MANVLTDDNSVWPEDRPPGSSSYPNVAPLQPDNGYWIPKLAAGLYNSLKSGVTLPGDVATGKASMADPQTQSRVMDMTGTVMGGAGFAPAEEDALNAGFRLYHGTRAKFDKPSNEFINTGQGAQTYGWGHYGAQAEPVALDMRDQLATDLRNVVNPVVDITASAMRNPTNTPDYISRTMMGMLRGRTELAPYAQDPQFIALLNKAASGQLPDKTYTSEGLNAIRALDKFLPPPEKGHMQEWEVQSDPSHFLDWTGLADEQSSHVMAALQKADFWPHLEEHLINDDKFGLRNPTGADIYHWVAEDMGPQDTSMELLRRGIPGTKVLDQRSRMNARTYGLSENDPQLTRNFAIADPDLINVVRHYNAAGVPATLANMAQQGQTP